MCRETKERPASGRLELYLSQSGLGSWLPKVKCHLSPCPVASQARHESVAREETFAARIVVRQPTRDWEVLAHGHLWSWGRKMPCFCTALHRLRTAWNGLDRGFLGLYMFPATGCCEETRTHTDANGWEAAGGLPLWKGIVLFRFFRFWMGSHTMEGRI
jgi:hypothetical protein